MILCAFFNYNTTIKNSMAVNFKQLNYLNAKRKELSDD